jgi:predicted PurR-regulated permease PerM
MERKNNMQKQKSFGRRLFGCVMLVATVICIWSGYSVIAPVFLGAIGISALID